MSDEPKPTIMQRIKSWFDLSLAAMAAIVVGIVLLSIAAIAWLIYSVDPNRIAWGDYLTIPRAAGLFALWTLSCITTYFGVRVWMNDVPTGDRRIREGWNAGMLLLSKHGVKLSDLPCFVVLGCATRHEQDLLVGAEGFSTPHQSSSSAPAIDWHLSKDRILIFCRDIGVFAGLLHGGDSSTAPSPGKLAKQSTQNSESAVSDPPSDSSPDAERDLKSIESDTKSEADVNEEEIAGNELLTGNTTATLTTATLTTATPVTASVRKNTDADQKMAADLGLVEICSHAGQLQFAMQGLV